jgi:hypothetical protein
MTRPTHVVARAAFALVVGIRGVASAQTSVWQASTGFGPDQICPAWTLMDTASANPSLGGGVLTLSTAANGEDMFYVQDLDATPDPLVVEFRTRFVSGLSGVTNRGPLVVIVTTAAGTGTLVFIDLDDMALVGAGDVVVDNANNNTSSTHTYRMEITAAGAVSVTYEGTPTLTGTTFADAAIFGPTRRIAWGDASGSAFGSSAWESFAHNGTSCQGATTTTMTVVPTTTSSSIIGPTTSSTTLFGATTTSTTRAKVPTTTSTSLPVEGCEDVHPGSLTWVRCRLDRLETRIEAEDHLGRYRAKLLSTLGRGIARANEAAIACDAHDDKTGRRRVKQLQRHLINMAHRLRGLAARKQLPAEVRAELLQVIEGIKADVTGIRKQPCAP